MNGAVEKAARRSGARIVLGARGAEAPPMAHGETGATADPAAELQRAEKRAAQLAAELAARDRLVAELQLKLREAQAEHTQCRQTLEEWQADLEQRRADAEQRGRDAGHAAAEQTAQQQQRRHAEQWERAAAELAAHCDDQLAQLRAAVADIALAAAAKILGAHAADAQRTEAAIAHLIAESGLQGPLCVRVAPAHHAALQHSGGAARLRACGFEVRPDADVDHGGCLLESAGRCADARYEIQLQKLRELIGAFDPLAEDAP